MKKKFSAAWKKSKQPRKQRKYRYNAPLHIKKHFLNANLSKELRKKYSIRSFSLRSGDKVKILRGQFKGKEGKIESVNTKKTKIYVSKVDVDKKDGSKTKVPIKPSNVQIMELNLDDKMRLEKLNQMKKLTAGTKNG